MSTITEQSGSYFLIGSDQGIFVLARIALSTGDLSFESSTSIVTVDCKEHGLSAGDVIVIEGADQKPFNGTFTVTSAATTDRFTYTLSGLTPATDAATGPVLVLREALGSTVTGQMFNSAGVQVGSDVTFEEQASGGRYFGTKPASMTLTEGAQYILKVTIVATDGNKSVVEINGIAKYADGKP